MSESITLSGTPMTDAEVLNQLLLARDQFIKSGKLIQRNITAPNSETIFYHSFDELEAWIEIYDKKVNGTTTARVNLYA